MEFWYTASKTFAMLCVVLGILLAFLYALKRLTQKGGIDQCQIKLISTFSIAPRKQIMVLDVMQERLVLGVTAEHICCISKYPITVDEDLKRPLTNETIVNSEYIDTPPEQPSLADKNSLRQININPNNLFQVQSEK
jgi:flagellar biosynthetic protein FliO